MSLCLVVKIQNFQKAYTEDFLQYHVIIQYMQALCRQQWGKKNYLERDLFYYRSAFLMSASKTYLKFLQMKNWKREHWVLKYSFPLKVAWKLHVPPPLPTCWNERDCEKFSAWKKIMSCREPKPYGMCYSELHIPVLHHKDLCLVSHRHKTKSRYLFSLQDRADLLL